jgi:hypothetical protein
MGVHPEPPLNEDDSVPTLRANSQYVHPHRFQESGRYPIQEQSTGNRDLATLLLADNRRCHQNHHFSPAQADPFSKHDTLVAKHQGILLLPMIVDPSKEKDRAKGMVLVHHQDRKIFFVA